MAPSVGDAGKSFMLDHVPDTVLRAKTGNK